MSKVNLDLSKFKHVSSDDKTTRLKHQDGHFLVLSHKHLGKDGQDQLAALAKGGKVKSEKRSAMSPQGKDVRDGETAFAKEEAKGRAAEERHVRPNIKGLADGGDVVDKKHSAAEDETVMNHIDINGNMSHRRADPLLHPNARNQGGIKQAIKELPSDLAQVAKDAGRDLRHMVGYAYGGDTKAQAPSQEQAPKQYDQTDKPVSNQYHGMAPAIDNAKSEVKQMFGMAEGGTPDDGFTFPDKDPHKDAFKNAIKESVLDIFGSKNGTASAAPQSDSRVMPQNQSAPSVPVEQIPVQPQGPQVPSTATMGAAQASDAQPMPDEQEPIQPPQDLSGMVQQREGQMPAMDPNSPAPLSSKPTNVDPNSPQAEQQLPTMRAPQQDYSNLPEQMKQHYLEEDAKFAHDLNNGHITPLTYQNLMFDGKSTLGKIGSVFGMLMAGAGSGLTHQPNVLIGMMDNIIKNDIEGQVKSKDNAQNFVRMNLARLRQQVQNRADQSGIQLNDKQMQAIDMDNLQKATTLGYMQSMRAVLHTARENVEKLPEGSPQRLQAEQAYAMMAANADSKVVNLADQAIGTTMWLSKNADAQGTGPDKSEQAYKDKQQMLRMSGNPALVKKADYNDSVHVPAATGMVGEASRPITPETQASIDSGSAFEKQLHDFIQFTKNHSGDLNPADYKYGKALAAELQGAYRMATKGGVYKEGEQNFIGKLINEDPTVFFNKIRVLPSLKALQDTHHAKMNQIARNNGFKGYDYTKVVGGSGAAPQGKLTPQQQTFIDYAKRYPNAPGSASILKKYGQ